MPDRRRTLKALAAAGLLGPAGISGLIRDALAKGDVPIKTGLHKIRGEVMVNHRVATEGQLIKPGDTIVTGRNSEAIYVIGQDAYMQRELTTVSFGAEALQNLMRVVTGKILSVFGKGARDIQVPRPPPSASAAPAATSRTKAPAPRRAPISASATAASN
jgi:hypothetical protein